MPRHWTPVLLLVSGLLIHGSGLAAQVAGTAAAGGGTQRADSLRALVEYVGGANLYLAAGIEAGLVANDTVEAREARGVNTSRLRVISSTDGRSVLAFVGRPFPVTRGDTLTVRLRAAAPAVVDAEPVSADSAAGPPGRSRGVNADAAAPPPAVTSASGPAPRAAAPRLNGSLAFDVDASSSRATGDGASRDPWRFVTPTVRFRAIASGLPGDVRIAVNTSWTQLYATGDLGPGRSDPVRIYQVEVEKAFEQAPVQLRAGRFFDRHDLWGGYLDGASVRLGGTGNGPGFGVSAGRTPIGAEQVLFSGSGRLSVFADYRRRGGTFGYDMDVVFTRQAWPDARADRYAGLTQRFRFGSASLYQRARVRFDPAGAPALTQLDVIGALPLGAGWMVRGRFALRSYDWISGSGVTAVQRRERAGGGISWSGRAGSLSLDAHVLRWGDRPQVPVYSGSFYLPRLLGPLGLSASATTNRDPDLRSSYVAPGLLLHVGSLRAEASWRLYRTETETFLSETTGTSFSISAPLRPGLHVTIRGDLQNGAGSSNQRLYTGFWAAF